MAALSSKAVALVALVALASLLVTYVAAGPPVSYNASAFTADPNWENARATWYGAPTGAGPDDDGTSRLYTYMRAAGATIHGAARPLVNPNR